MHHLSDSSNRPRPDWRRRSLRLQPRETLEQAHEQSEHLRSQLTPELLSIPGMTSPKVRHLLNNLGRVCQTYLEVGSLYGATLSAACFGNELRAFAIDNFSEFDGTEENLRANINAYCRRCRFLRADAFSPTVLEQIDCRIELYFYDGCHSLLSQAQALTQFEPVFAREFIYVCDDWNWAEVRDGTRRGLQAIRYQATHSKEIFTSNSRDLDGYWNGLGIFLLKAKRKRST